MSRLAEAIREERTQDRSYVPMRFLAVDQKFQRNVSPEMAVTYRVGAIFQTQIKSQTDHGPELTDAVARAKRMIIREVFGEYIPPLYTAIHALDDMDIDRARKLLLAVIANFEAPTPFQEIA